MRILQAFKVFLKILCNKKFANAIKTITVSEQNTDLPTKKVAQMIAVLQREARFVDFFMENIENIEDEKIGAAVRQIHKNLNKTLKEYISFKPIIDKPENTALKFDKNTEYSKIKFIGNVPDKQPEKGILRHHGWEIKEILLPEILETKDVKVIYPAEVEIE